MKGKKRQRQEPDEEDSVCTLSDTERDAGLLLLLPHTFACAFHKTHILTLFCAELADVSKCHCSLLLVLVYLRRITRWSSPSEGKVSVSSINICSVGYACRPAVVVICNTYVLSALRSEHVHVWPWAMHVSCYVCARLKGLVPLGRW